jgi:tetratricopeptide (TPR) repeat protein
MREHYYMTEETLDELLEQAQAAFGKGDRLAAIELLIKIIREDVDHPYACDLLREAQRVKREYQKGLEYFVKQQWSEAAERFERVERIYKLDVKSKTRLFYRLLTAFQRVFRRKTVKRVSEMSARDVPPDRDVVQAILEETRRRENIERLLNEVGEHRKNQEWDQAAKMLEEALELARKSVSASTKLGEVETLEGIVKSDSDLVQSVEEQLGEAQTQHQIITSRKEADMLRQKDDKHEESEKKTFFGMVPTEEDRVRIEETDMRQNVSRDDASKATLFQSLLERLTGMSRVQRIIGFVVAVILLICAILSVPLVDEFLRDRLEHPSTHRHKSFGSLDSQRTASIGPVERFGHRAVEVIDKLENTLQQIVK